jgi:uncharacterized coiled-coil DUF342 family protein
VLLKAYAKHVSTDGARGTAIHVRDEPQMTDLRKLVKAAASAHASAFKARSDIESLSRKLRAIMRKVDTVQFKPDDRHRLADELSRLSGEAHWFAEQVNKGS